MPELKPDHSAVLKTHQFGKQIGHFPFQLELISAAGLRRIRAATESRDAHDFHIAIENWLSFANRHILNPAELVYVHQIHESALCRVKVLSHQRRLQAGGCL